MSFPSWHNVQLVAVDLQFSQGLEQLTH